jgi:hypothetical protein
MGFRVKYPLVLSDRNQTWIFLIEFRKVLKYCVSRTSYIVFAFHNVAKSPNKKRWKIIFDLNDVIGRAQKSNSVQITYSHDFYV